MNILLFVFAILMVMGMMTYAKLQTFLVMMRLQTQYVCYMKSVGQEEISKSQKELYEKEHITTGPNEDKEDKINATSKINIYIFTNSQEKNTKPNMYNTQETILKRLINLLYQHEPFYESLLQKRPNFIDEILQEIMSKAESPIYKDKIKKARDLANIDLGNSELQEVFAKMLSGSPVSSTAIENCQGGEKRNEAPRSSGYISLQDFITLEKKQNPYRIYLAPPEILYAIYGELDTVNAIIQERNQIYSKLKTVDQKDSNERSRLSDLFKQLFEPKLPPELDHQLFNFEVSKTQPKNKWSLQ